MADSARFRFACARPGVTVRFLVSQFVISWHVKNDFEKDELQTRRALG